MHSLKYAAAVAICAMLPLLCAPTAAADEDVVDAPARTDIVTYEVVSPVVRAANIEYVTDTGRIFVPNVALPWRYTVPVDDALGPPPNGSQVRADWRSSRGPARWVSVRVYVGDELICQNTLDIGNAACYGSTRRIT
ncbi:hypothetical protein MPRF_00740 [Mycolicibacterium parafortuitum]|uniref:Uncharacterized protein n=1 Tax=Mycolicibacterium parafortuitum TaxID=39692 RepID=A0A7I7TX91_MYCPF|nr:hypothetical protein [Mycolicibacterium parafortuitum]BBY73175.1 hypothetical protein MPRF_00740 [Mycolicibacterium parafortuitum]